MTTRITFCFSLLVITCLLGAPTEAHARGLILITHGDAMTDLGDVSPQQKALVPGARVGFKSSYAGVFWINLWTWGGEYCLYQGDTYQPIDRATAARLLGKPEGEVTKPFLYRFPLGLLILGVPAGLILLLLIYGSILMAADKAKVTRLLREPHYQRALEIASARTARPSAGVPTGPGPALPLPEGADDPEEARAATEAGIRYLTDSGEPREDAERNLTLILKYAPTRPETSAS